MHCHYHKIQRVKLGTRLYTRLWRATDRGSRYFNDGQRGLNLRSQALAHTPLFCIREELRPPICDARTWTGMQGRTGPAGYAVGDWRHRGFSRFGSITYVYRFQVRANHANRCDQWAFEMACRPSQVTRATWLSKRKSQDPLALNVVPVS